MTDNREGRYINPYTDFGFKKLFQQAEIAKYDEVERRQYEASLKEYWDYTSTLETAERKGEIRGRAEGRKEGRKEGLAEGLAKGREEGLAKGLAEGIQSVAKTMKNAGKSIEEIAAMTGLDRQVIEEL